MLQRFRATGASLLLAALLWAACGDNKPCRYKPEPIFEAGLPHIEQYSYEVQGPESREALLTDRGIFVEIYQEVCQTTRQEYRFTVPGSDFASLPDSAWVMEASRQFVFLSSFSEKQAGLRAWADVLEAVRPRMRLGEDIEVEAGIFARVDKIVSADHGTLLVVLAQK